MTPKRIEAKTLAAGRQDGPARGENLRGTDPGDNGLKTLISQNVASEADGGHGCRTTSLAELRNQLGRPSSLTDGHRQRLLGLVQKLARVQALGDEYSRVDFSHYVTEARELAAV